MKDQFKSGDYTAKYNSESKSWGVSDPYAGLANIDISGSLVNFKGAGFYSFSIERLSHITTLMSKIKDQYELMMKQSNSLFITA